MIRLLIGAILGLGWSAVPAQDFPPEAPPLPPPARTLDRQVEVPVEAPTGSEPQHEDAPVEGAAAADDDALAESAPELTAGETSAALPLPASEGAVKVTPLPLMAADGAAAVGAAEGAAVGASAEPAMPAVAEDLVGPPALIPEADPASHRFIGPPLVPPITLLGADVPPGSKRTLNWTSGQSFAGGDSVAPINVVRGTRPGPVLCLAAAVHGDEINGVEIVRRVVQDLDPDRLSGTVIAAPIVNLFGFARGSRYLPDRRDLNRFFPGSQRGSIAARLAHGFFTEVVRHCDSLVDFHTGSFDRSNLPQVRADLRLPEVLRFSRGFGALPVLHSNGSRGMLRVAATQAGIPAVTFEVGAPGTLQVEEIEEALEAIDALMHYLGMVPDAPEVQEPQAVFYQSQWVRANVGGLFIAKVKLGDRVRKNQPLGMVVDPVRNVEKQILAPIQGRVIGMARNQVVLPGFATFHIGEETSAEEASDAAASGRVEEDVEEDPDPGPQRER